MTKYHATSHPRLVYAWAGEIGDLRAEIERLRAALLRIRDDREVSSLAGPPSLWPSTIAGEALATYEQGAARM